MILPDQAARAIEPQWFDEGENIRVADAFVVDIMLNANGQTYETLRRYSQILDLDGCSGTHRESGGIVADETDDAG